MMVRYKDNANLELKTVQTIRGETEYRINCKKFKHEYYIMNEDCFLIKDLWYRTNSGLIVYDYELKCWIHKSDIMSLTKGIVDLGENENFVMGFFTANPLKNITIVNGYNGLEYIGINTEVFKTTIVEHVSTGKYYFKPSQNQLRECTIIKNYVNNQNAVYNIEDNVDEFEFCKKIYELNGKKISKSVNLYGRGLGNTTFGVELETIRGYMPKHILFQNGVIVCRDGSLKDPTDNSQGAEFTTIPLQGVKGVQSLVDFCKELKNRTEIDKQCAVHIHIGNIETSKQYMIALYMLCCSIQEDVFKMFPYSKQNEVEYAGKNKNYCQKLKPLIRYPIKTKTAINYKSYIDEFYLRLFSFLSEGAEPSPKYNRKNKRHPRAHKWERHNRYYWVNFMNAIFSQRNTIEFRIHQGSTNPQKVVTWLFMCNAMVRFAEKNIYNILLGKKYTFKDVLHYYNSESSKRYIGGVSHYLISYYDYMKEFFETAKNNGDYTGEADIINDKTFIFPFYNVSKMFK